MAFNLYLLTLTLLLSSSLCAKLQIFGASQPGSISGWTAGPTITSRTSSFCPNDLPAPFTLVCLPSNPSTAGGAQFFINGKLTQKERVSPYTIRGDYRSSGAKPWNPPSQVFVKCVLNNGETVAASIKFECDGVAATRPPATRPPRTEALPPPPPSFQLSSGSASSPGSSACVKIPALAYDSTPTGWVKRGSALFFKPDSRARGTVRGGTATATYSFNAPATGRFGFTLDMETNGGVDHNDVWVSFEPNGFILTRGRSTRLSSGWTKAYHNRNGRSNMVYSVDFNPHSFATRNTLVKGKKYTVKIGGRSTRTGFYSIIMFPCTGSGCDSTSSYWTSTLRKCS